MSAQYSPCSRTTDLVSLIAPAGPTLGVSLEIERPRGTPTPERLASPSPFAFPAAAGLGCVPGVYG